MSYSQSQEFLSACQGFAGDISACLPPLEDFHTVKKKIKKNLNHVHLVY